MNNLNALSFSLYGDKPFYAVGAIENTILAREIYPGWDVVVHVEKNHYAIDRLKNEGAKVIEHDPRPNHQGMLWRFHTCADPKYDCVAVRDADNRICASEFAAVKEWMDSGKPLHRMQDHRFHKNWPIMGGMWGMRSGSVPIADLLSAWKHPGVFKDDQRFLKTHVWPRLKGNCMTHSSLNNENPFPVPRPKNGRFIGGKVIPTLPIEKTRVVVLNPERYQKRKTRFQESYDQNAGSLRRLPLEWFVATPKKKMMAPPSFRRIRKRGHWWAATCDHLRIMEETLAGGYEYLLLFEDDAKFAEDFHYRFWKAWCALPPGWLAVRLGRNRGPAPATVSPGILDKCPVFGGQMLANFWSREGMLKFYDYAWHHRNRCIDGAFEDLRKKSPDGWYQTANPVILKDPLARQHGKDK